MTEQNMELQLKQFKSKVAKSKDEFSNLKGQQKVLLGRLSKELGITSVKGAKKHLERLKSRLEKVDSEVVTKMEEFTTTYGDLLK